MVSFSSANDYLNKRQSKITQRIQGNYYENGIQIFNYLQSKIDAVSVTEMTEDTITIYYNRESISLQRVPDEYQYGFKEIVEDYEGVFE